MQDVEVLVRRTGRPARSGTPSLLQQLGATMRPQDRHVERRLAAIFAADVAGYSRLMSEDEVGTLRTLTAHRTIMDGLIAEHGGRIANTAGDSVLAEFPSVVDAVQCAVTVQEKLREANAQVPNQDRRLHFRIGVHVGDVMVRGGDLLGDGVNIAARIQSLAEPGGVWLSSRAFEEIEGKLPFAFESRGEQQVKNIARPVRAYALAGVQAVSRPEPARVLLLPDKPSLAVLPFANLSGPEDDYFCDGLVEDIITALSRVRWFFVIARNSSFTYKGQAIDVRRVGRDLGVRYVLEGAVRKSASRIRITGQLVEAETGHHLWADKFDGNLADIFDLQDQVAEQVAATIEPSLRFAEVARASTKPTENLTAYDLYLRALPHRYALSEAGARTALAFATTAIEHDPRFATAKALAAYCYAMFVHQDWDEPDAADKASALARAAVDDGWDDPEALRIAGHVLGGIARDYPAALAALDRALALNPNSAAAWTSSGWVRIYVDAFDTAIDHFGRAVRLSPLDPEMYFAFGGLAQAHLGLGNVAEALAWSEKCTRQHKGWSAGFRVYIECLALAGRMDEAQAAAARYLATYPGFRIAKWAARTPVRNPEIVHARQEVYRAVGLPE